MGVEDGAAGRPDSTLPRDRHPVGDRHAMAAQRHPDDLAAIGSTVAVQAAQADVHVAVAECEGRPLLVGERVVAREVDNA